MSQEFDVFVDTQIKRIAEYSQWEDYFNDILTNKATRKDRQFNLLDREWIEKWKESVGYKTIKDKCNSFSKTKSIALKKEISDFFLEINAQKKVEDLGQIDCSKIKKDNKSQKKKNIIYFEETSNFIPIEKSFYNYFNPKELLYANGDFIGGKCFLTNTVLEKKEKKRIVIIEKNFENSGFNEVILTLEPDEDIKKVKDKLKEKTIKELMNDGELKNKIIKKEIDIKKIEERKKEEGEKEKIEKKEKEKITKKEESPKIEEKGKKEGEKEKRENKEKENKEKERKENKEKEERDRKENKEK